MKKTLIEMTGQVFGCLTVLSRAGLRNGEALWNCQCECGIVKQVRGVKLRHGRTKSCGSCLRKGKAFIQLRGEDTAAKAFYTRCKKRAKKINQEFSLSFEEAKKLFLGNCNYCGDAPYTVRKIKRIDASGDDGVFNGLDRLNSDLGYTSENTVSCCPKCNYAKHVMSENEFKEWMIKVYNHYILGG